MWERRKRIVYRRKRATHENADRSEVPGVEMKKTTVVISRKWHHPQITMSVTDEGIRIEIPLEDFLKALCDEIGKVTWVFTKAEFLRRYDAAVEKVISGIKEETVRIA